MKSNDKKSWHSQLLVATPYLVDFNICSRLCVWSSWVCVDQSALILRLACLNCLWVAVCRPTRCLERTEWLGYVYWFVFFPFFIFPLTIVRFFYWNFVATFGRTGISRGPLHKSRISPSWINIKAEFNQSKTWASRLNRLHKDQTRMSGHGFLQRTLLLSSNSLIH